MRKNAETARAPQFFTIVLYPLEQGLRIPVAFMRKYGGDLQKAVLLKVQTGASWRVELVNRDNITWMQKGWKEFAEFYSIKKFHFLVFGYQGNSEFQVLIFDLTATEIEYPLEAGIDDRREEDASVEILGEILKNQQEIDDIAAEILNEDISVAKPRTRESTRNQTKRMKLEKPKIDKERRCDGTDHQMQSQSTTIYAKEEYVSYQRATAFRSEKPFFLSLMQPSYVSKRCSPCIPLTFAKKYLPFKGKKYCNLSLRVEGRRRTWRAVYTRTAKARIGSGWKVFMEDNSLKVGDVCVFELVQTNAFNVVIFRA